MSWHCRLKSLESRLMVYSAGLVEGLKELFASSVTDRARALMANVLTGESATQASRPLCQDPTKIHCCKQ
jgi:hypothetical protein